eukprot:TRINITY_DN3429_c0_g1_i3.p1 TRINITY_DN3429_c0_g1~~TRINITY_DN3429_c0_g1_i3.p1  ORF type:complete len:144 (+),score=27.33 TRINITY_DN3429_c0_g1_i3:157-588(+)
MSTVIVPKKPYRVVWPSALNSKKSISDGRKIPISKCVDNPNPQEIFEACVKNLQFKAELQPFKCYPRDFTIAGRVLVSKESLAAANPPKKKKKALLALIASEIAKNPRKDPAKSTPSSSSSSPSPSAKDKDKDKSKQGKKNKR